MSDIINELSGYISKLSSIKEYIEQLESSKTQDYIVETYELNTVNVEPITYLFRPKVRFSENAKCSKCGKNRLIEQENNITNNFAVCECFNDSPYYENETIKVSHIECAESNLDEKYYVYYDGKKTIYINTNDVLTKFNESDLNKPPESVYYVNKEDCQTYCESKNEGSIHG